MNIFCCNIDPRRAAFLLSYTGHVHKMLLESLQIMAAVAEECGFEPPITKHGYFYKISHRNHPTIRWAASDCRNFLWLLDHAHGLSDVIWQVSGKRTATMVTLQNYTTYAWAMARLLPEKDCFVLYHQDKNLAGRQKCNHKIVQHTMGILQKKYQLWQSRVGTKRKIRPTWPQFEGLLPALL